MRAERKRAQAAVEEGRMSGTVRHLHERDFDALLALFDRVAGERRWIGTEPGFDREVYRKRWRNMLAGQGGAAFVWADDHRIVGYIGIYPHAEYGHVIGMLVDAQSRGRGIGKALLANALEWARAQGLAEINLLVFPHNERALALYRNAGFEQREYYPGDVTRQTGEVWDSVLMTKRL